MSTPPALVDAQNRGNLRARAADVSVTPMDNDECRRIAAGTAYEAISVLPRSPEADFRARVRVAVNAWTKRFALSPRESDVLFFVTCGRRVSEVHRVLGCSRSTVKSHAGRVVAKTRCPTLIEAACALLREISRSAG